MRYIKTINPVIQPHSLKLITQRSSN